MAVIGSQFCVEIPVTLTIHPKTFSSDEVIDINGNILFKLKSKSFSRHSQHTLFDANGNPIVTFNKKLSSSRGRWRVFRGESTEDRDLIFTTLDPSFFLTNRKRDVYLASNVTEQSSDFKIKCNWSHSSCVVYAGNSYDNIIAQMEKKGFFGTKYEVTVNPNVDYAFIITLVFIIEEINKQKSSGHRSAGAASISV